MDETGESVLGGLIILLGTTLIIVLAFLTWPYLPIAILIVGGLIGATIALYHFVSVLIEAHKTIQ